MKKTPEASQNKTQATQKQEEMVYAVLDLSCFDWLNLPHWDKVGFGGVKCASPPLFRSWRIFLIVNSVVFTKALELNDFPTFLLWLTEQDPVLAGMVATRQEEFEVVFKKVWLIVKGARGGNRQRSV